MGEDSKENHKEEGDKLKEDANFDSFNISIEQSLANLTSAESESAFDGKILIVDDSKLHIDGIRRLFDRMFNIEEASMLESTSRTQALEIAKQIEEKLLIISDVYKHSDMDAIEFIREIKKLKKKIYITIFTGHAKRAFNEMPGLNCADALVEKRGNYENDFNKILENFQNVNWDSLLHTDIDDLLQKSMMKRAERGFFGDAQTLSEPPFSSVSSDIFNSTRSSTPPPARSSTPPPARSSAPPPARSSAPPPARSSTPPPNSDNESAQITSSDLNKKPQDDSQMLLNIDFQSFREETQEEEIELLLEDSQPDNENDVLPEYDEEVENIDLENLKASESTLGREIHTWVDDINAEGKLGQRWHLVVGDPNIRLKSSALFLQRLVNEQRFLTENNKIPSVLIMGMGNAIEPIYLAKKYPDMKIKAIEIDPNLRKHGEKRIGIANVENQIEIIDCEWQNLKDKLDEKFDLILSCGNEIECLPSREDQRIVLRNVFEILNPGGRFAMDLRNADSVKRTIQFIRNNGIPNRSNIVNNPKQHPGYPMYNGSRVMSYPLAVSKKDDETRVWFNYAYINPMDGQDDAILTMLLSGLQDHLNMQNEIGLMVSEIYADFKLKEQGKFGKSIDSVSGNMVESRPNFYQIVSIKPIK